MHLYNFLNLQEFTKGNDIDQASQSNPKQAKNLVKENRKVTGTTSKKTNDASSKKKGAGANKSNKGSTVGKRKKATSTSDQGKATTKKRKVDKPPKKPKANAAIAKVTTVYYCLCLNCYTSY